LSGAVQIGIATIVAFLLGSVPTGYIAGRLLRGIDLRQHGSGNLGTTNVFRVLGTGAALPVLLADVAKGTLAVAFGSLSSLRVGNADLVPLLCALAAVLGHSFSPFVGFRGGKGVATAAGAFLTLAPWGAVPAVAVWLSLLLTTRIMSVASLAAATVFPVTLFVHDLSGVDGHHWSTLIAACLVTLIVYWRHWPNVLRLRQGQEKGLW
jgi:glycerol-3-phosphate acyltransferase PlsY